MADAGWYPDPQHAQEQQYWDGQAWTGQRRGVPGPDAPNWQIPPAAAPNPQQPTWSAPSSATGGWSAPPQSPQATQPYPATAQWQQPPAAGWPGQPAGGGWAAPPAPARPRRRRGPLIGGAIVVVAALVLGVVLLLASGDDAPALTYKGKEIASASDTLKTAEANVAGVVRRRHGASNDQTRCYFAQPQQPAAGAKKTDVADALRCGPVLFVDGDASATYLSVPITGSDDAGGKAKLQTSPSLDSLDPAAVGSAVKLVRPDGKKAPAGAGGLAVPKPPAATKDIVTVASLGPTATPRPLDNAALVGKDTKVTLEAVGEVSRYGDGDDARSAPAGEKLLALQLDYGSGDVSGTGSARAQLVVSGSAPRSLPEANGSDEWVVVAVPTSATALLQLTDAGFTQTLSLPDGRPGAANLQVLARAHRTAFLAQSFDVPVHLSDGSGAADITLHASASLASLDFWVPGHEERHASSARTAILSVRLNYTDRASPGKTFGFDPELLQLQLPKGGVVRARNVASAGKIFDVFEVPASFTTGTLRVTGSERIDGVTIRVTSPRGFAVSIPAG